MYACTFRWPDKYLPTSPDRFAMPSGKRLLREDRRRCELQTYPPATTKVLARNSTSCCGASRCTATARTTRPVGSTSRLRTNVRVRNSTRFVLRSLFHVKSGEYFAPIGQIGEQVSFRQQAGRPSYVIEFLDDGWLHIVIPALLTQLL